VHTFSNKAQALCDKPDTLESIITPCAIFGNSAVSKTKSDQVIRLMATVRALDDVDTCVTSKHKKKKKKKAHGDRHHLSFSYHFRWFHTRRFRRTSIEYLFYTISDCCDAWISLFRE